MSDDDVIREAKAAFKRAHDAEDDNRKAAEDDIDFGRMGNQWPENVRRDREAEGRPCLTINRMPSFIRQVVNDSRQNKPSIKVHPVDSGADPETAEILNGLIRNIEVTSNADVAYDTAIEYAVSGGFGYLGIDVDYSHDDAFEQDICIERVANPFTVFGDPDAESADGSDWNSAFRTDLLSEAEFRGQYPDFAPVDWESYHQDMDDALWRDDEEGQKMIRVANWWRREEVAKELLLLSDGTVVYEDAFRENLDYYQVAGIQVSASRTTKGYRVTRTLLTGADVLKTVEWPGRYIPIVPVYGDEVVFRGRRHFRSLIHFAKDAQIQFNYWRTAATELVALAPKAPYIGEEGAFDLEPDKWATANTRSYAYLEVAAGKQIPQRQPFAGVPAGALQEAMNAQDDMKAVMGIYDASLGARSNETSGRAIMARQREGDVSTFHFLDNMTRAIRQAGRIIVDLIPHVYHQQRVIRILGEDEAPGSVRINQDVPMTDEHGQVRTGPDGQPLTRVYDLTAGKYDVTVKAGPNFTTRREEAAIQMTEMVRAFPAAAPVIGDLIAKNLDWPGADEIAKRLRMLVPQQASPDAMAQQAQQMLQAAQAEIAALKQDRAAELEKLRLEGDAVKVKAFEAETNRIEALIKAFEAQAGAQFDAITAAARMSGPQAGESNGSGYPPN